MMRVRFVFRYFSVVLEKKTGFGEALIRSDRVTLSPTGCWLAIEDGPGVSGQARETHCQAHQGNRFESCERHNLTRLINFLDMIMAAIPSTHWIASSTFLLQLNSR